MANLQGMGGVDLRAVACEIRALLPLWVGKVYGYGQGLFAIRLQGEEHRRFHLLAEPGRRVHLVDRLPEPPKIPPSFAMLLRKYLEGGRVLEIRQLGLERTLAITVGRRETEYHLFVEIFDEGNLVLCDREFRILQPLRHHRFREREVVPGALYQHQGKDCSALPGEEFASLLRDSGRDLVRTLAVGCMLGGRYAEEVCAMAGIAKNLPASQADASLVCGALTALIHQAEEARSPAITLSGCWPFPLAGEEVLQAFPSYSRALEAYYGVAPAPAAGGQNTLPRARPRGKGIREQQEETIRAYRERIAALEQAVSELQEQSAEIASAQEWFRKARGHLSWQEIRRDLQEGRIASAGPVTDVDPATGELILGLTVPVRLGADAPLIHAAGACHDEIKRLRRKIRGAETAMAAALPEKERSPAGPAREREKPRWFHRFRWFETSDGTLVVGGRDAGQNEELVKRYLEGGDTFVHADVHGGSVVVVKGSTHCMDQVAQFAASYSGAWKSGHFTTDVYAAAPEQVSKTPPSGEYLARGGFIVRGERTWYRDVPLGVAIGLQEEPALRVIGGPPSALEDRARIRVTLHPGHYEPNDVARKVVRILKGRLSGDQAREARAVLRTEAVAAFVPAGGSEIEEEHEG
ncbi:MAG: NFACT family protein [Methanomicrobiales archaeon]|nr:NFACT family protein [Methanomicrobiales archaeon]